MYTPHALIDAPLDIHLGAHRCPRAGHDSPGTNPTTIAESLDGLVDDIDDILSSHIEHHRASRAACPLDTEPARAVFEDLPVSRDAVRLVRRRVLLDVPDHLPAVLHEWRAAAPAVLERRVAAVVLTGEDVAGVVVRPTL